MAETYYDSLNSKKYNQRIFFIAIFLTIAIFTSCIFGRYYITPRQMVSTILYDYFGIGEQISDKIPIILYNIRFPRIFLACLVGASLSVAGCTYQGVFQNPMASPDILGASSGAAFGASLAILFDADNFMITVSAFVFSILTVFLSWYISSRAQGRRVLTLVLAGMMISSLFTAGTSYIKLLADPNRQLQQITFWLMGSLSGTTKKQVLFALLSMSVGIIPLIMFRWKINILTLGDEEAKTLGIEPERLRVILICAATLLTAASVSVSGMIGWVGLIIPHFCRRIVGNSFKYLIPASIFTGALFLLVIDDLARNLLSVEIPIGILTSFVGAPFLILVLMKGREPV